MGKNGDISSHSSRFFRIILPQILRNGTLELPKNFVKEHDKSLSKYVRLKLPNGVVFKMELRKCDGRAWIHEGWQNFVEKRSIESGYFLVFRYKGGSCFSVRIFDLSTSEIEYHVSSSKTSKKKAEKRKFIQVKEEDNYDEDEILVESPHKVQKSKGIENANKSGDQVIRGKGLDYDIARVRVLEKAKDFHSPNPHFTITMQPTYILKPYLAIPAGPARSYFLKMGNKSIYLKLNGEDERTWSMTYNIGAPPNSRVNICSGWNKFSRENHLREGDICAFDLVNSTTFVFEVTIFRISDEKVDEKGPRIMTDVASPLGNKTASLNVSMAVQRANAFECKEPSFSVLIRRSHVRERYRLSIPYAHASEYLKNQNGKDAFLHRVDGKTWPVKYYVCGRRARISPSWKDFAVDNNLKEGDVCVFELFSQEPNHYNVTVFRAAES